MDKPIDNVVDCLACCKRLKMCERIGVDGEWTGRGREAKLSLLQVSFQIAETGQVGVYLFDAFVGGKTMFDEGGLKDLLEDPNLTKVLHDCRLDSDVLYHSFGIKLDCVIDTQVLYYFNFTQLRPFSPLPVSLKTLLRKYAGKEDNSLKDEAHALMEANANFWEIRPMTPLMLKYAREDVLFLLDAFRRLWAGLDYRNHDLAKRFSDDYARQVRSMKEFPHDRYQGNSLPSYGIESWDMQARSHWDLLARKYPDRYKMNRNSETPTEGEESRLADEALKNQSASPAPTVEAGPPKPPKSLFFPSEKKKSAPLPTAAPVKIAAAPSKIYAGKPTSAPVKRSYPAPHASNDILVVKQEDLTSLQNYRK